MKKKLTRPYCFLVLPVIAFFSLTPVKVSGSDDVTNARRLGIDTLSSSPKIVRALVDNIPPDMETKFNARSLPLLLPQYVHFDTVAISDKRLLVIFYCSYRPPGKISILKEDTVGYSPIWEEKVYCESFPGLLVRDLTGDSLSEISLRWVSGARPHENLRIYKWEGDSGRLISPLPNAGYENSFIGSTIEIKDADGDGSQEIIIYQEAASSGPLYSVPGNEFTYKYDKTEKRYMKTKVKRIEEK